MGGLFKFLFFCLLAIATGIASVSVPIDGKTAAEHLQALWDQPSRRDGPPPTSRPADATKAAQRQKAAPAQAASAPAADPVDDHPNEADRKALDELIGKRVR